MQLEMRMKSLLRPRFLIVGFALILVAGWVSDYLFTWSESSRHVLAWVRTEPMIYSRFGDVSGASIARHTDYRNRETGLREREYVILLVGSISKGRATVVDTKPRSGHEYQIWTLE